jgi:hypothetical protein
MARDPMGVIDDIEAVRARNNKNWMDLLRLAYRHAPEETIAIVQEIFLQDSRVTELTKELTGP